MHDRGRWRARASRIVFRCSTLKSFLFSLLCSFVCSLHSVYEVLGLFPNTSMIAQLLDKGDLNEIADVLKGKPCVDTSNSKGTRAQKQAMLVFSLLLFVLCCCWLEL